MTPKHRLAVYKVRVLVSPSPSAPHRGTGMLSGFDILPLPRPAMPDQATPVQALAYLTKPRHALPCVSHFTPPVPKGRVC